MTGANWRNPTQEIILSLGYLYVSDVDRLLRIENDDESFRILTLFMTCQCNLNGPSFKFRIFDIFHLHQLVPYFGRHLPDSEPSCRTHVCLVSGPLGDQ